MKILIIGKDANTERFFSDLGHGHAITHCADGARALAELRNGSPHYDWIVVQGMAKALNSMDIASAIRAMGVWAPIAFIWDADHLGAQTPRAPGGLRALLAQLSARDSLRQDAGEEPELVFEYHAPLKRRGQAC